MTQYETADLAQQQYGLLQTQQAAIADSIALIMLSIFAYMVAAHFMGHNMSKARTRVLSALYVAWVAYQALDLYVSIEVSKAIARTFLSLSPDAAPKRLYDYYLDGNIVNIQFSMIFLGLLASLYFMYSIRKTLPASSGAAPGD